jgi:hypothetical protein
MLQAAIKKMASNYITAEESAVTDFHMEVNRDNGELTILDDDDKTLARVHIKEWEDEHDDAAIEKELQSELTKMQQQGMFESQNIAKPYSFVLTDEDDQSIVDLLIIDDDTLILSADLLEGFDEEMNAFLKKLLEE